MAHINPSDGNTLAGCGGTSEAGSRRTTAFGFGAGANSTGSHNVFIGHRAGRRHVSGSHNIFIGPRAGRSLLSVENTLTLGGEGVESWLRGTMEEGVGRRLFLNGKEIATALHFAELEDLVTELNTQIAHHSHPHTHPLHTHPPVYIDTDEPEPPVVVTTAPPSPPPPVVEPPVVVTDTTGTDTDDDPVATTYPCVGGVGGFGGTCSYDYSDVQVFTTGDGEPVFVPMIGTNGWSGGGGTTPNNTCSGLVCLSQPVGERAPRTNR